MIKTESATTKLFSGLRPKASSKEIARGNMNWSQAKKRYPSLNPFGDKDKDGRINMEDCKPLNRRKQDDEIDSLKGLQRLGVLNEEGKELIKDLEERKKRKK